MFIDLDVWRMLYRLDDESIDWLIIHWIYSWLLFNLFSIHSWSNDTMHPLWCTINSCQYRSYTQWLLVPRNWLKRSCITNECTPPSQEQERVDACLGWYYHHVSMNEWMNLCMCMCAWISSDDKKAVGFSTVLTNVQQLWGHWDFWLKIFMLSSLLYLFICVFICLFIPFLYFYYTYCERFVSNRLFFSHIIYIYFILFICRFWLPNFLRVTFFTLLRNFFSSCSYFKRLCGNVYELTNIKNARLSSQKRILFSLSFSL